MTRGEHPGSDGERSGQGRERDCLRNGQSLRAPATGQGSRTACRPGPVRFHPAGAWMRLLSTFIAALTLPCHRHRAAAGSPQLRVLFPTTNQMASNHVPSAAQYPRRGDGRKDAFDVASDGARRHLAPATTTSTVARTRERGREQEGRTRQMNGQGSPCSPRALQGRQSRSFTDTHGQSKPLLDGRFLRISCGPKLTITAGASGRPWLRDVPRVEPKVVGHQLHGYPPRRQRRCRGPGAGIHVVQPPSHLGRFGPQTAE